MQRKHIVVLFALALALAVGAVVASAASKAVTISVEGMHCGGCATSVEKKLRATEGVEDVRVSVEKKEAWVKYDEGKVTVARLREVIDSTGFKVVGEKDASE
jgi:copper chaperone CopZ